MEKRMKTNYPAAAIAVWMVFTSAPLAGVGQERIRELQREVRKDLDSATLTGCVARDTAPDTYKLTNVTKDGDLIAAISALVTVRLSTIDVDLAKHVGHRVSVTGLYSAHSRAAAANVPHPATSSTLVNSKSKTLLPTLKVKSLTMVADSCSEPADLP
jgi:hypothetical protein